MTMTFTYGTTPKEIIALQLESLVPEGEYHFRNLNSDDYDVLWDAVSCIPHVNYRRIREHNNTIVIPNDYMVEILENLNEENTLGDGADLRSSILQTLEIEEI